VRTSKYCLRTELEPNITNLNRTRTELKKFFVETELGNHTSKFNRNEPELDTNERNWTKLELNLTLTNGTGPN